MSVPCSASRSLFSSRPVELCLRTQRIQASRSWTSAASHGFHHTARRSARRRPKFKNISADEIAKIQSANKATPKEMDALRKVYFPEQMAAVEAAQGAIDPVDMLSQWQRRDDTFQLDYVEDFATVKPSIDQKPRLRAPPSPHARWMKRNELMDDIWDWAKSKIPGLSETMSEGEIEDLVEKAEISDMDIERWWKERGVMTDNAEDVFLKGENGESLGRPTAFTSALPDTVPGVSDLYATKAENEEGADPRRLDPDGVYNDLRRKTGLTLAQLLSIKTKTIVTRRVVNQSRMGKIMSTASMAIAGNGNGWLGFGQFKSVDPIISAEQARLAALGNMMPIRRYENRTIYGNVEKKFGASIVQLYQRPPGFGLRVPARLFEICRMAGISDLAARMPRSRNPMNTVKATIEALMDQPDPEEIALGRGQKLVDVRKVYYGGTVM